jgi:hypothetical protein
MIEYDGEPTVHLKDNINELMSSERAINHDKYYNFFEKYMLKDYKYFLKVRREDLKLTSWFSKFFANYYGFSKEKEGYLLWRNVEKVLKQSNIFHQNIEGEGYNPFKDFVSFSSNSYFYLNKKDFNRLKKMWSPYIEYIHNKKMKEQPTYAMKTKISNF